MRKTFIFFLLLSSVFVFNGCSRTKPTNRNSKDSTKLTIKGSDTMVILNQRWAEDFMKKHPDTSVQITGGGSGTGIAALLNGVTDIAAASRPLKAKERQLIENHHHNKVLEIPVAIDAVTIFVNGNNPIEKLSISQLKQIFIGKILNWKELGGSDATIIVYSRENNSGTYEFFKEHVLKGEDFSQYASYLPGTAALVSAIEQDHNAIGYGGVAYLPKGVKAIKVTNDTDDIGTMPIKENVMNGSYPLARYLYYYTIGEPIKLKQEFIDFVLSPEGQVISEQVGYFPINDLGLKVWPNEGK